MKSIGVEICFSKSGGPRYYAAEANAVEYIAGLLKAKGWGIDRVRKHQDWSGKYCPHRILAEGRWEAFKQAVVNRLNGGVKTAPTPVAPTPPKPNNLVTYRVYANGKWLPWVNNDTDYAGIKGIHVQGVQIQGDVEYQVHAGGKWYPYVKGFNNVNGNGYAGDLRNYVDAVRIKGKVYRVGTRDGGYLPWVNGTTDYAGIIGRGIDKLQIK